MYKPIHQAPINTMQNMRGAFLGELSDQASTSKPVNQDNPVKLASPSDAPVTKAELSRTGRSIPSVTPNTRHLAYVDLAREIIGVNNIVRRETPINVQIQSISGSAREILDFWEKNNPGNNDFDLSQVGEGKSINLAKLSDVAKKAGLLVSMDAPENSNKKGKEVVDHSNQHSDDEALIADLKSRGIDVDIVDPEQGPHLVEKNNKNILLGKKIHNVSHKITDFERSLFKKMLTPPTTTVDQLDAKNTTDHYTWVMRKSIALANVLSKKEEGVDEFAVETKLRMLFNHSPTLVPILERATMDKVLAALSSPLMVSSPPVKTALNAIDSMHQELSTLLRARAGGETIRQTLEQKVKDLQATGNLFGRASAMIRQNPSNNDELLDHTVAEWLAKGKELQFNQPVICGVVNSDAKKPDLKQQNILDNLVNALGVDASGCEPNTPVVVRMLGNSDHFNQNVVDPYKERLIVNDKVDVITPGDCVEKNRTIDLKQAPLIQTLENIICGRHELVHPDLFNIIDKADIFDVSCSKNPKFAQALKLQFHNPDDNNAKNLKRTMVARLLLPALCLEGTSVSETAKNLAGPTLVGLAVDVGKNYIPDHLGALKTILIQTFFLGVDAADNLAGAWPEVQSLLETMGIEKVNYETVFGEPAPEGGAAKAREFVKLALGLRSAEGEAGPAVATGLRSAVIGTVIGNALTLGYSLGIGALDLNPALRTLIGIPAIVGTSLGIAINFAVNHADLSLAYKKQIHDGTLGVPDTLRKDDPAELNDYCSNLAKRQLMLLSGTGPAAKAFTFAPLAALANLLGYVIPTKVVEAAITPLMPGMENLVRLVAMNKHSGAVEQSLKKLDERVIAAAAEGKAATLNGEEFDNLMYGRVDNVTADITLMVGGLLVGLLGRNGFHKMQIAPDDIEGARPRPASTSNIRIEEVGELDEGKVDEIVCNAQQAAKNLQAA